MNYVVTVFQVLFAEIAGVLAFAGVMYAYWSLMTKNK